MIHRLHGEQQMNGKLSFIIFGNFWIASIFFSMWNFTAVPNVRLIQYHQIWTFRGCMHITSKEFSVRNDTLTISAACWQQDIVFLRHDENKQFPRLLHSRGLVAVRGVWGIVCHWTLPAVRLAGLIGGWGIPYCFWFWVTCNALWTHVTDGNSHRFSFFTKGCARRLWKRVAVPGAT